MPRVRNHEQRDLLALAAARFRSEGLKQKDVAARLGMSQPEVSRLLDHARGKGWLHPHPSLVRHKITPDLWRTVDRRYFSRSELSARVRRWAPSDIHCQVYVVRETHSAKEFGDAAADRVSDAILDARMLGIMWGRAITMLVDGFAHVFRDPPHAEDPVRVVPLCGEPLFLTDRHMFEYSSSRLAARVSRMLNGETGEIVALTGVPAYIPTSFRDSEARAVRKFVGMIPGYQTVFGDDSGRQAGLIDQVDTVLTGIGVLERSEHGEPQPGVFLTERLNRESISNAELHELVFGDIGGVLIERSDLVEAQHRLVQDMNRGWMGLQRSHLERCAREASDEGGHGVVVVAREPEKAELIHQGVHLGLVNVLVIDERLEAALGEIP